MVHVGDPTGETVVRGQLGAQGDARRLGIRVGIDTAKLAHGLDAASDPELHRLPTPWIQGRVRAGAHQQATERANHRDDLPLRARIHLRFGVEGHAVKV